MRRQDEDGQPGYVPPGLKRRPQAFVGLGRRQPDVDDRHVLPLIDQRTQQRRPVGDGPGYLEAVLLEQAGQALAEFSRAPATRATAASGLVRISPSVARKDMPSATRRA